MLADIVGGCERPSASTAVPEEGIRSRATEATNTATESTTTATDAAIALAEAGSNSTKPRRRQRDTVRVIKHLLDFMDPI